MASPAKIGVGLALPTATLAVVALSGHSSVALASGTTPVTSAASPASADELLSLRSTSDERTSREAERKAETTQAIQSENSKRATTEIALAASAEQVIEVAPAPAPPPAPVVDAPAPAPSQSWVKPLNASYAMTSSFGWRWGSMHAAQDLSVGVGTPVSALSSGTVKAAGWMGSYGNRVEIVYWDGTSSIMAHLSRTAVSVGQKVTPGQIIGYSGNTGNSTGPHLHLEIILPGGSKVAPVAWLARKGVQL